MKKIGSIQPSGRPGMFIYYDEKVKNNPYRVYLEWNSIGEYGLTHHKKQINRYADLNSCGYELWQYALQNNEEGREGRKV